jgi:hypothetical protein
MFKLNIIYVSIITLMLNGCSGVVPLWVTASSAVGDIILTDQTGKSSTEHGLDVITGKNCQLIRFFDNQNICMNHGEYVSYLLSLNCETYTWNFLGRVYCK